MKITKKILSAPDNAGTIHPSGLALHHPAVDWLLQYATKGCPMETGQDWTMKMIQAVIDRGLHESAMIPEAMAYIQSEVFDKVRIGKAKIVKWIGKFKCSSPEQLKVSPISSILHRERIGPSSTFHSS